MREKQVPKARAHPQQQRARVCMWSLPLRMLGAGDKSHGKWDCGKQAHLNPGLEGTMRQR